MLKSVPLSQTTANYQQEVSYGSRRPSHLTHHNTSTGTNWPFPTTPKATTSKQSKPTRNASNSTHNSTWPTTTLLSPSKTSTTWNNVRNTTRKPLKSIQSTVTHGTILVTFTRTEVTMKMLLIIMKGPYSTIRRIRWRWLTWGIVW
jgi:hypothetical protein